MKTVSFFNFVHPLEIKMPVIITNLVEANTQEIAVAKATVIDVTKTLLPKTASKKNEC